MNAPLLTDKTFFLECLDLELPGMEEVKNAAAAGDFSTARTAFAAYIRRTLDAERFFRIPFETAENIYRYPDESTADACRRVCEHTFISCGIPHAFGKGSIIDWEANPTPNQYKEWTWQLNRHNEWKMLAHEYRLTGDEKLAECFAELFDSWVKQAIYPSDAAFHETNCWRTIECGIRMGANWPYTLFAFYRSAAFTDDLLINWYKSVWEHGDRLSRIHGTGNWLIMEMNGLGHIGMLYPQFKSSAGWLQQAITSLEEELDRQLYPDGFQYELSTNYHHVLINNYQRIIETANVFGITVPESFLKKLVNGMHLHIRLMMPDGTLPSLNDGARLNVKKIAGLHHRLLPDDTLRWAAQGSGEAPAYTSVALPWSGQAVMRTGWTAQDTWALFDAGPFGRGHQHEDKLSVLLYANGKLLLSEAGSFAYDDSAMRQYVLSSRAHNTVLVDGCGQDRRSTYTWLDDEIFQKADFRWHFGNRWDFSEGFYNESYDAPVGTDVIHRRKVFFLRQPPEGICPLLVVVDRLYSTTEHTFEALWHIDSTSFAQTSGRIAFRELDLVHSTGDASITVGQTEPTVQGFLPSLCGTTDCKVPAQLIGSPCVSVCASAQQLRMVTVLAPYNGSGPRITCVTASAQVEDEEIRLTLDDGRTLCWNENDMEEDAL